MMILIRVTQFLLLFAIFNDYIHAKNDYIHDTAAFTINVMKDGNDTRDCLNGNGAKACKTLDYALSNISHLNYQNKILVISIHDGTFNYSLNASDSKLQFWKFSSISIIGKGKNVSIIQCKKLSGAGFAFFNSSVIVVQDIAIEFCGSIQNSTSFLNENTTSKISAALYFAFCQDVWITRSLINQSAGIGVVMYNTKNTLQVTNSTFSYNRNNDSKKGGGGGFYAEFTYCNPGYTKYCVQPSCSNVNYVFEGSEFSNNLASDGSEKNTTFISANGTTNIAFGRGGGISLIFKGNVENSNVTIIKCNINFNNATWGAGLFVEFQDNSNNNKVMVKDTVLGNNYCELAFNQNYGTGGGGARIGFISFTQFDNMLQYNTIAFENCTFTNNEAYWGGGVSYYTFREPNIVNATNNLSFNNCLWTENRAVLGSAIDLSVWHPIKKGVLSPVVFYECNFTGNINEPSFNSTYYTESYLGTGAFYSDSISVAFQNFVNFKNNFGSAMALSAASASFYDDCNSNFSHNSGWTGGAIALLGNAWLEIHENTNFTFLNNSAILNGGAISVVISSRHDLLSSRNCFLQYHKNFVYPKDWHTHFKFINNTAPGGHGCSIFATSLLSCVWGNSQGQLINGTSIKPFDDWPENVFSIGNNSDEISTEISNINFDSVNNSHVHSYDTFVPAELYVAPGQPKRLPLVFKDDEHNLAYSSIYLLPSENNNVSVANNLTAVYNVTLLGKENSTAILRIVTDGPRIVSKNITVKLVYCPPGYYWISPSNITYADGRCKCGYGSKQSWNGILNCNDDKFRAHIKKDYWAGCINPSENCTDQNLHTGKCPKNYCNPSSIASALLPYSAKSQDLSKSICEDQNRKGILCGECLDSSYCVAINSRYYNCTTNVHNYSWAIWLATEYLPSTILLVIILFYDINLHSESLGSVVMYFQVYSALNIYSYGEITPPKHTDAINKAINFLYNIWNLEYFGMWLSPYCLAKKFNTMQVLMVSYISGFYPFLLIFIYILLGRFKGLSCCNPFINFCIRLKWRTSLKASIINGLSTFWTLAYTKLALVSCLILTIGYLEGRQDLDKPIQHVVLLQGNYEYFKGNHLFYAIPALVILVLFVILPSLALLCYPLTTRIMAKVKKFVNLDGNRFYAYISTKMERPFIRFKPLLDSFQGHYKPGCEFFAGLVYWYRLGIFFTYSFASGSKPFYINSVISMISVILVSFFQPFKNTKNNTVMLLIMINIALINLISLYDYYEDITDFMSWFQLLLTIVPFIYFVGCAAYGIKKKIQDYINGAPPAGLYTNISSQELDNDSLLGNVAEE